MAIHVFVVMPFGYKEGIDFDRVYHDYIRSSLESAGYVVFRADEELCAGEIRSDMFQELLLADLVVADLTLDNPNVWYELGVRHALRARGIILVQSTRKSQPFDVYTDRKLHYHLQNGLPDPATIEREKAALVTMAKETIESWHGKKISPVYQLLPYLQEPDWQSLRIGGASEFWARYDAWQNRIELARKCRYPGDILILADEAPVAAFRAEAWIQAGIALCKAECFEFALEQLEKGLAIQPNHLRGLQQKGVCLQRLAVSCTPGFSADKARMHYEEVLKQFPLDAETWALLGRVDKDAWVSAWRHPGASAVQMQTEAAFEDALLRKAIAGYVKGYQCNPAHYYSGINALTLMHLYRHVTADDCFQHAMATMAGAVRFAAENDHNEKERYWAAVTLAELEVLVGTVQSVDTAYKKAVAYNDKDWFALHSSREQLLLLNDLGFRSPEVHVALSVLDRALVKLVRPEDWQPRYVFLFSGHMIDRPDRSVPRFPSEMEHLAAQEIANTLTELGAGPDDLALTQGACGGDLLFTEAALQLGMKVHWLQPFCEPEFITNSVACSNGSWRKRYFDAKCALASPIRPAPAELGAIPQGSEPGYAYERCNLWLLYTALAYGVEKVRFICLWNGEGGDGPGGTAHLYHEVKRRTGQVYWLDTRTIFREEPS